MSFGDRFMFAQVDNRAAKRRAMMTTVAIALHGAMLVGAIIWSFIKVEELPAPQVTVTFLAAAAPPPPPPPPPPPRRKTPKVVPTTPTEVKPDQVRPKEPEPEEDDGEDDGVEGGVKGGVKGGVVGGVVGGIKPAPPPVEDKPVFILPTMEQPKLLMHTNPVYPPAAKAARLEGDVVLKICFTKAGGVQSVTVIKGLAMGLTEAAQAAAKSNRYQPYKVGGKPVAACQVTRYQFKLQ